MLSLSHLDVDLLSQIAALETNESAARLRLVNKHVRAAVTPVLPLLYDVSPLRLVLPVCGGLHGLDQVRPCIGTRLVVAADVVGTSV